MKVVVSMALMVDTAEEATAVASSPMVDTAKEATTVASDSMDTVEEAM